MEKSGYRIIDANFNRAREALRVIEDYCRFVLNCAGLSGRAKELRHRLSAVIADIDEGRLLAGRDTIGDIGIGQKADSAIGRKNIKDTLTAACKRLPEALRVLAETIRCENYAISERIEAIRYAGYTLEKDVALFANAQARFANVQLYVLINSNLPGEVFPLVQKSIKGGADCLQLRAKSVDDNRYYALAYEFVKVCRDANVISIINDRVDIAAASGADGVHLGQNDLPIEQARRLQLTPMIFGKSTHSIEQLTKAISELPTYVSLGPVFATPTKPESVPVTLDYVKKGVPILSHTGISHVAIGGIAIDNVENVLRAGSKVIAVSSAVTYSADPQAECRKLKDKISEFFGNQ
jgi:thiamine-phosphate pyrophosphorylase